jgi:hypothetical protein
VVSFTLRPFYPRDKSAYKILDGKPEGKKPLGRPGRVKIILKWILRETGWEVVDWMHLIQDRDQWWAPVNTVMNLRVL